MKAECDTTDRCTERRLALADAVELLSGKWKLRLIQMLAYHGPMKFKDLRSAINGITPKVLVKDLRVLEENLLIERKENNTRPITVSYSLSEHANEILPVISTLLEFGLNHRKAVKKSMQK